MRERFGGGTRSPLTSVGTRARRGATPPEGDGQPMPNPVQFRASAVVVHEGRVLLVAGRKAAGHWLPPGGHVEFHEGAADAAAREAFEETGVRVRTTRLIGWRQVWWDDADALELYFAAELVAGSDSAGDADHGWQWAEVAQLPDLNVLPEELAGLCELASAGCERVVQLGAVELKGRKA